MCSNGDNCSCICFCNEQTAQRRRPRIQNSTDQCNGKDCDDDKEHLNSDDSADASTGNNVSEDDNDSNDKDDDSKDDDSKDDSDGEKDDKDDDKPKKTKESKIL